MGWRNRRRRRRGRCLGHSDVDRLADLAVLRTAADEEAVGGSVDVDGVFAGTVDPDGVGGVAALVVGQRYLHHVVLRLVVLEHCTQR